MFSNCNIVFLTHNSQQDIENFKAELEHRARELSPQQQQQKDSPSKITESSEITEIPENQ